MPSNVDVKITADVADLTAKFAVAKAESNALSQELNKLARQAAAAGDDMSAELKNSLDAAAASAAKAKAEVNVLGRELKEAQGGSQRFTEGLGSIREGLAAIGLVASVEAVKSFGEAIEENASHIEHEARVLQLSSEAYQAFRQAAVDSGVDTETADNAIRRFTVNVGNAQAGMGTAAKAFVEMGISANQSNDALLQQVSAFMLTASAGDRARIAQELFGKSGAELIPLFEQWAQGADALGQKYDALGRRLAPGVTEAAEKADIALAGAMEHMKASWAPAVTEFTTDVAQLLDVLQGVASINWATGGVVYPTPPKPKAPPKPVAPTEKDEITALDAIDSKMHERETLEKELAQAVKARKDAEAAGDTSGYEKASQAVRDLKKELDSMNKVAADPAAKKAAREAAAERRREFREIEADAKKLNETLDAEARSDAQRDVAEAKSALAEKKALLEEEYSAHKITAQQKFDDTVTALNDEVEAERAALKQEIDSLVTSEAQKHDAMNRMLLLDSQTNAQIAEAHRQLTQELHTEDEKRLESWRQVNSEIEGAENELIGDIFTKRQSLVVDLEQLGLHFLQEEIANLVKIGTEHALVNAGMLASDKATTEAGFLARMLGITQSIAAETAGQAARTGAAAAGTAARTATEAAGATASKAISTAANAAEISADAAKAAAGAYSALAGIPIIGPIIAPVAAGVAYAAVTAFGSFDKGVDILPHDMIAQVHAGERIMPAADNRALISALNGGGAGGGDSHLHYSPTFIGKEPKGLREQLADDAPALRDWFHEQVRDRYIRIG